MKNSLRFGALAVAGALTLAACGSAPSDEKTDDQSGAAQSEAAPAASSDVKACMISDSGGFEDKSFNQSGMEGLMRAKSELGVEVAQAESTSDADFTPNIENMVAADCDIVIGVGFLMADAIGEAAAKYPETKFALVDSGFSEEHDNAKPLLFNTAEASYLAGYAAAGVSETGKVGAFLGMNLPSTAIFNDGYYDGIAKYNEVHDTNVELLGWSKESQDGMSADSFDDVSKGKQFTEQLIQQGADVIMPVAGQAGVGTLAAAQASGNALVVWVDADGVMTQPEYADVILTSVMKQISAAVFDTIESVVNDGFDATAYVGTLENGGVAIAPWHELEDRVSPELQTEIDDLQKQIESGDIVIETVNVNW